MGYMGLDGITDSDNAADLQYMVAKAMAAQLKKGLKEKGNTYNTSGPINVALIFEEAILPCLDTYLYCDELMSVAVEAESMLAQMICPYNIDEWGQKDNWTWHMKAFKRMQKSLKKYIDSN